MTLTLGITNALVTNQMASAESLVVEDKVGLGGRYAGLVPDLERASLDYQWGVGLPRIPEGSRWDGFDSEARTETGTNSEARTETGTEDRTEDRTETDRLRSDGRVDTNPGADPGTRARTEAGRIKAGWVAQAAPQAPTGVDGCDCPDCKCPWPDVCKDNNCKLNYALFFTADWCTWCHKMHPHVERLQKEGYIIYTVDADQYNELKSKLGVRGLPSTIIYDGGKPISHFEGFMGYEQLKRHLKKRSDQKPPDPEPEPIGEVDYRLY